jgi:phosphoribosyl 1,2-cyclic phosphate phosphodiesterase
MEIIILGSGGVNPPPRPGCQCKVCREARARGVPYSRTGPSLFIFNESLLINAPEDIRHQLNRDEIDLVENLLVPNWKPECVSGLRVIENLNYDSVIDNPVWEAINVYIPSDKDPSGCFHKLLKKYRDDLSIINLIEMHDCEIMGIGNLNVLPVKVDAADRYYFVIYDGSRKIVYLPSRFNKFQPISEAFDADILIVPCYYWQDKTVFRREITNKAITSSKITFESMLETAENMRARKIMITHIEEDFGMSYRNLRALPAIKYQYFPMEFTYDGMRISL